MPQLWTETFVTQYFWFSIILFALYYFVVTKFIPNVANAIKARQVSESVEIKSENFIDSKTSNLFNDNSKQEFNLPIIVTNWDYVQNEWLSLSPENDNNYWTETTLTEESNYQLETIEEEELNLEEFITTEEEKSGE